MNSQVNGKTLNMLLTAQETEGGTGNVQGPRGLVTQKRGVGSSGFHPSMGEDVVCPSEDFNHRPSRFGDRFLCGP